MGLCRSKGSRANGCQSWRSKKILPIGPARAKRVRTRPLGRIFCCPPTLTAGSYAALWPSETHSTSVDVVFVQESSSTFKVFYLHSKYPHFNSTYLVRVPFHSTVAALSTKKYCNANEKCDNLVRLLLSLTMPCLPKVFKNCFGITSIVITGDKSLLFNF